MRKDPIIPTVEAIEDKQRCIDYWGQRCERAEAEIERLREALADMISDAERQMKNPSHHMPFSLPRARSLLTGGSREGAT
jgi:hypothetical protein